MKLRVCALTIALVFAQVSAVAQWADYGLWSSASVSQKVAKKTYASADFAARFDRDFSRLGTTFIDSEISREVLDDVDLGVALRVGGSQADEHQWEARRRFAFNAKYKTKVGDKSSLSFRLQYQSGTKGTGPIDFSNAARFKAAYIYKVSKEYRLSVSSEIFFKPVYSSYEWSDTRGRLSVRKKISKRRYVTFGYQLECPRFGPDPRVEHAIICDFSLEKKRRKSGK